MASNYIDSSYDLKFDSNSFKVDAIGSSAPSFLGILLSNIFGSLVLDIAKLLSSLNSARLVSFLDSAGYLRSICLLLTDVPVTIFGDSAIGGSGEL